MKIFETWKGFGILFQIQLIISASKKRRGHVQPITHLCAILGPQEKPKKKQWRAIVNCWPNKMLMQTKNQPLVMWHWYSQECCGVQRFAGNQISFWRRLTTRVIPDYGQDSCFPLTVVVEEWKTEDLGRLTKRGNPSLVIDYIMNFPFPHNRIIDPEPQIPFLGIIIPGIVDIFLST
jgi:hypothetical protein